MKKKKKTTIVQIAGEAGVSIQTVSRVINNRHDVAPEPRQRILESIARHRYQPNAVAQSMASRRTKILGLVAPDFSEFSAARIAAGAQATAQQLGYFFILTSNRPGEEQEPGYVQLYRGGYIEGLLYFALTLEADYPALIQLSEQGLPIIAAAQRFPDLNVPIVDHDNVK